VTDPVQIAIIAGISAGVPGILAAVLGFINRVGIDRVTAKANETHLLVNSRMTELLELTRMASRAEGVKEEKDNNAEQRSEPRN
jgi:hypothetical protein